MVAELTCREFQLKVSQPWSSVASLSSLKSSRVRVTCSPTSPLVYAPHTTGGPTHTRSSSLTRSQESRGAVRRRDCPVRSRRICHPGRSVLVRYGMRARGEYYKLAEKISTRTIAIRRVEASAAYVHARDGRRRPRGEEGGG